MGAHNTNPNNEYGRTQGGLSEKLFIPGNDRGGGGVYMWCHVSVPQGEGGPVEFQVQESVVLPKPRHQARGQGRGELQVLVSKQQRSHCGVHTDTHSTKGC